MNTSSQLQPLSSPGSKAAFQHNVMSRMIARQADVPGYNSLDAKTAKRPLVRIDLQEDAPVSNNRESLERMVREQTEIMKREKKELEQNLMMMQ